MYPFVLLMLFLTIPFTCGAESVTYNQSSKSASNWRTEGQLHLGVSESELDAHKKKRCVKLNNYWCLKDVGWLGGIGKDSDDHTAFKDGYHAARAAVRNFRTAYIKHNRKSAFAIMSAYAPPNDCVGSNAARLADGTCKLGKNPTKLYSMKVISGITDDIHADLMLFDSNEVATEALLKFLINMSNFETGGLSVIETTIRKGICMEANVC